MKRFLLILVVSLQFSAVFGQNNLHHPLNKIDITQKTDTLIREYIAMGIFSGVVLIAENGKPFYEKAFGLANRETNTPNTLDTRFVIGSMNKSFTSTVILQLIQENKLNLNDHMVTYLNGFRQPNANKINIGHLLTHSSGFGDYHHPPYWKLPYEKKNVQGILHLLKDMELLFEPGSQNEYSNTGYIILGAIIEKVTGKSYAQNVEERILRPLQLNSFVTSNVKKIPNRAIGYLKTYNGYINNEEFITEPRSDGGFYANAYDVLNFYRSFFYNNELINDSIRQRDALFKRISGAYEKKGAAIPLAGGFNGANTVHLEMPADNISIVVLANMDEPVAENLAKGIHAIIVGKVPEKPVLPAKLRVYVAYKEHGASYVKKHFNELSSNWFDQDPGDMILNGIGYDLLNDNMVDEAIELFKLNIDLFPTIANCWDSYAEALLKKGDKTGAIAAYKKALEINPKLISANKMLEELED
jgi:CubicO group peptidase (beta-lactamase class C family)